jgi:hypothetical protein
VIVAIPSPRAKTFTKSDGTAERSLVDAGASLAQAQAEAAQSAEISAISTPEPGHLFRISAVLGAGSAGLQRVNTFDAEAIRHMNEAPANPRWRRPRSTPWASNEHDCSVVSIDSCVFPLLQRRTRAGALTTDEEFRRRVTVTTGRIRLQTGQSISATPTRSVAGN